MKTILVVGGAGYIGSHMVKALAGTGYHPVTLDNLSTGFQDAVKHGQLVVGSMADRVVLEKVFREHEVAAVMHFAAFSQVGESISDPAKYYQNNIAATQVLLDAMIAHDVKHLVFSSTAAIYGNPEYLPINEAHPKQPVNPYGRSKWMVEQMLADYDAAYDLRSIALRYFNAAGADSGGELGECHDPETHLIPLVLQTALGKREKITVFGSDYNTRDGSCIRDYIHVEDLCNAHLYALEALLKGAPSTAYNLGNGEGFTVREVIDVVQHIMQTKISVKHGQRRPGDPPVLIANANLARAELNWFPRHTNLNQIIQSAALWEIRRQMESDSESLSEMINRKKRSIS